MFDICLSLIQFQFCWIIYFWMQSHHFQTLMAARKLFSIWEHLLETKMLKIQACICNLFANSWSGTSANYLSISFFWTLLVKIRKIKYVLARKNNGLKSAKENSRVRILLIIWKKFDERNSILVIIMIVNFPSFGLLFYLKHKNLKLLQGL